MLTLFITKSDPLDLARYLPPGLKIKVMDYLCYNHQELTMDIHAAQQVKADKMPKLSFRKQISVN